MNTNVIKTINYIKRNGVKKTYAVIRERLENRSLPPYVYEKPSEEELQEQKKRTFDYAPLISLVVPTYETNPRFMEELLVSVTSQTYGNWELILADASSSDVVKNVVENYYDAERDCYKIKYHRLKDNKGISENTNAALEFVSGDYIGLLDHDDLLTPDALFHMVDAMNEAKAQNHTLRMLYSDEDKCDETASIYYDPNIKTDFNFDMLLSNNYICHFLVVETGRLKRIGFRSDFDGAQDYDLILRVVKSIEDDAIDKAKQGTWDRIRTPQETQKAAFGKTVREREICHVPKVLYHWRCHLQSTAANPASKLYAYEAGKRALQAALNDREITATAIDSNHVGFYVVDYGTSAKHITEDTATQEIVTATKVSQKSADITMQINSVLEKRPDIMAVGGSIVDTENKITSGILNSEGVCIWKGLDANYAGPCNRASVRQNAALLDARTIFVRDEDISLYVEVIGIPYVRDLERRNHAFCNQLDERIWLQRSRALCERLSEKRGGLLLWLPELKLKK